MGLKKTYSLVTITYLDDLPFSCLQAKSLAKYLPKDLVREIFIITNEPPNLPWDEKEKILDLMGPHRPITKLIQARHLTQSPTCSGWFSQQALKLLACQLVTSDYYLVLDAKNTLVFPLTPSFLEQNGKPKIFLHGYRQHPLLDYLINTLSYFHLPAENYLDSFLPTTTPFIIPTQITRQMIAKISPEKASFAKTFLEITPKVTEFFLLGAYLCKYHSFSEIYNLKGTEFPIIWKEDPSETQLKTQITKVEKKKLPFFSVHRAVYPLLTSEARHLLAEFWTRRGLFANLEQAVKFCHL